jgi:hypothetical protein
LITGSSMLDAISPTESPRNLCLHLGDPAEVQRHAAHELHVEVALAEDAPGRLAHGGVGLDRQVIERLAVVQALLELDRLVRQGVVGEGLHLGLERVDGRDELGEAPDLLAFTRFEDLREHAHGGTILPVRDPANPPGGVGAACG